MSEEALNGAVEAAPEVVAVPENPISVDNIDHEAEAKAAEAKTKPEKVETAKPLSTRETIERAAAKIEAEEKAKAEAEPKDKAKPAETQAQRDEKGKFAAKEAEKAEALAATAPKAAEKAPTVDPNRTPQPHDEPPARFSPDAKAAWTTAPDPVKAEVHRAVRELESGIEEHRKQWEPVKPYADMAKQYGTTVHEALERYVAFDKLLNDNPLQGIESILQDKGLPSLREFAAQIMGQKPEEVQSQTDNTVRELRQTVAELQKQLGGVTGHIQQQTKTAIDEQIAAFTADPAHSNFEALADKVAEHIRAGMSLEEAYQQAETDAQELAKRLGFIPAATVPAPAPVDHAAQTDKGQKSITGAPSAGSAPATHKPSPSIKDAVRKAMQATG